MTPMMHAELPSGFSRDGLIGYDPTGRVILGGIDLNLLFREAHEARPVEECGGRERLQRSAIVTVFIHDDF